MIHKKYAKWRCEFDSERSSIYSTLEDRSVPSGNSKKDWLDHNAAQRETDA